MKPFLNPAFILRFSIAIAYIILGIVLLVLPVKISLLNDTAKFLFAGLLVIYGVFRLYRAFRALKENE
jgi:hypothetical protein